MISSSIYISFSSIYAELISSLKKSVRPYYNTYQKKHLVVSTSLVGSKSI